MDIRPIRSSLSELNLKRRGVYSFKDKSLDDFNTYGDTKLQKIKNTFKDYIDNIDFKFLGNEGLFCFGANGNGKTFLTSIVVKEAYRHRYTSKRVTFVEYLREYTRVWGLFGAEKEVAEFNLYNDIKSVEFLVIDEVGKEIDSKVAQPIIEDLLRYREDNSLVTILVTNYTLGQLKEKYGNSVYSLIKGNCRPIKFVGTDRRVVKDEE